MKAFGCGLALALCFVSSASGADTAKTAYPGMAPVARYLIPRDAEIALARSAATNAIAKDAQIMVFTTTGFQTAVKGTNGFVCLVARSWSAGFGDPNFWNPQVRAPICYNAVAALSQVPETIKRTQIALAGGSEAKIQEGLKAAITSGELAVAKPGSLSYMLSKGTYFNHSEGHWLPHLMFYMPQTDLKSWGVGTPKSPVIGYNFPDERLTIFLVPIGRWSDGSLSAGSMD
ncbi:MAG TPA: hypothetical protein VN935_11205 [Rhizomicrobium sp.]|jgi:hypothetical protein|nr:hypothetical protein [Rhizomicrobium sp.]